MIDHELLFADGQTLTSAAAGAIVADLEQAENADLSTLPYFAVVCQTDIEGTIQPKLQHSDTKNGTYTDCAVGAIAEAPTAGTTLLVPTPVKTKRFIRAYFDGTPQGKVSAFLTWGRQAWTAVPEDEEKEESGDEGGGETEVIATLTVGSATFSGVAVKGFTEAALDEGMDAFGSLVPNTVGAITVNAIALMPYGESYYLIVAPETGFSISLPDFPDITNFQEIAAKIYNTEVGGTIRVKLTATGE